MLREQVARALYVVSGYGREPQDFDVHGFNRDGWLRAADEAIRFAEFARRERAMRTSGGALAGDLTYPAPEWRP